MGWIKIYFKIFGAILCAERFPFIFISASCSRSCIIDIIYGQCTHARAYLFYKQKWISPCFTPIIIFIHIACKPIFSVRCETLSKTEKNMRANEMKMGKWVTFKCAKFNCDIRNKCVNLLYQHLVDSGMGQRWKITKWKSAHEGGLEWDKRARSHIRRRA